MKQPSTSSGPKRISILGSTGSIGTQALDVIARYPERFTVVGLAAGRNIELLAKQVAQFSPDVTATATDGPDGLLRVALDAKPDLVLAATDGAVAFDAVFSAVERGIDVAVANKELIVAAGDLLVASAQRSGSAILPVDSEHSAVFQCLVGEDPKRVAAVVLTASGGPFWGSSAEQMADATLEAALAHPNWRMGTKNTIDSATMMNKGLEIIEASHLFNIPANRLQIAVHPQSIAHGFVVFTDGSVKGQLCAPDMRVPIGYALAYPDRLQGQHGAESATHEAESATHEAESVTLSPSKGDVLDMLGAKPQAPSLRYDFQRPDPVRFPCVRLAYEALERGGVAPAVLSAANEVAVSAFVEGKIRFPAIAQVVETTLERVAQREATLAGIREADRDARIAASEIVEDLICC